MIYYLALVFFLSLDTEPQLIAGPMTQEECRIEADKQNRNNKLVRDKKLRELGVEFVCFKVERVYL
jgi:hypothetical protein